MRHTYCYKLQGFDEDWNCIGANHSAIYTNIDPGHYTFLVKAANNDGVWSETPTQLEIVICPLPWMTWWAIMTYAAVAALLVYFSIKIRTERIKMKNQLAVERLVREREHQLSESKTQFFTNISHELRTPLSLIAMPLEGLAATDGLPPSMKDRLGTIQTNADKMIRLVNELMDFSKMENAQLRLRVERGELVNYITSIAVVFDDLAKKRNISFAIRPALQSLTGWFDHDKLEKILVNVLSNAFKFTHDNGQIDVSIASYEQVTRHRPIKDQYLKLVITDNGIGISPEELPYIFDKFYQANSSSRITNQGTGIGLSLTKGLVELHHGSIEAYSPPSARPAS
ncbi:MAG: hypothetical protein OHK0039_23590 [Bacteroidia bacterium]